MKRLANLFAFLSVQDDLCDYMIGLVEDDEAALISGEVWFTYPVLCSTLDSAIPSTLQISPYCYMLIQATGNSIKQHKLSFYNLNNKKISQLEGCSFSFIVNLVPKLQYKNILYCTLKTNALLHIIKKKWKKNKNVQKAYPTLIRVRFLLE